MAAKSALRLTGAKAAVLEQLCVCTNGKRTKKGDMVVFSSNRRLVRRTNLDVRSVSRGIAGLKELGLIAPKDSARRHRYAVRGKGGEIVDAYGFNLAPLLLRHAEFAAIVEQQKQEEDERIYLDNEISALRTGIKDALHAARQYDREGRADALYAELADLERRVPRRGRDGIREPVAAALEDLKRRSQLLFRDLVKQQENQSPTKEMSCSTWHRVHHIITPETSIEDYNAAGQGRAGLAAGPAGTVQLEAAAEELPRERQSEAGGENQPETGQDPTTEAEPVRSMDEPPAPDETISPQFAIEACPAFKDAGPLYKTESDFVAAAAYLRGGLGAERAAWQDGVKTLGELATALLAVYVYQLYADGLPTCQGPAERGAHAKKFGGLFRKLIGETAAGKFSLRPVLTRMRQQRMRQIDDAAADEPSKSAQAGVGTGAEERVRWIEAGAQRPVSGESVSPQFVIEHCPAFKDAGFDCKTESDFVNTAYVLRGMLGANHDAWVEGVKTLGKLATALIAVCVYQIHCDKFASAGVAQSFGGLFRTFIRQTKAGEFSLRSTLLEMQDRRMRQSAKAGGPPQSARAEVGPMADQQPDADRSNVHWFGADRDGVSVADRIVAEKLVLEEGVSTQSVIEHCPAFKDAGRLYKTESDFVAAAYVLRGRLGANHDAWVEGVNTLGQLPTALLAVYVYQLYADGLPACSGPAECGAHARKCGGLFRKFIRDTKTGTFSLRTQLAKLRQKHSWQKRSTDR